MSRIGVDQWGLQLALTTAQRATCCRRSVGCVLVDMSNHVLATGYNGVASGVPHCNERNPEFIRGDSDKSKYPNACSGAFAESGTNLDGCDAIHAEQNALLQCSDVSKIVTCYCTASPCLTCVKLLMNTGCRRIVFIEKYPHSRAEEMWRDNDGEWIQLSM